MSNGEIHTIQIRKHGEVEKNKETKQDTKTDTYILVYLSTKLILN